MLEDIVEDKMVTTTLDDGRTIISHDTLSKQNMFTPSLKEVENKAYKDWLSVPIIEDWLGKSTFAQNIYHNKYEQYSEYFINFLRRVTNNNYDYIKLIMDRKFLYGGRILSNRGLLRLYGIKGSLSNCYVIPPPEDDLESIFKCAYECARTYSYGGGCGIDISKLSPRGALVNNSAKETSGAPSFMKLYSLVTELIGQNGRRGALMISIDCNHPDVEDFINIKANVTDIKFANISVRFDDNFLQHVKDHQEIELKYYRDKTKSTVILKKNAHDIFSTFVKNNWSFAEPGCLFWDRIKSWSLLSNTKDFEFAGTNPCGEEPLPAGGSCLLGSLNLLAFVKFPFTLNSFFDFEEFVRAVCHSVNALDEVLEEGLMQHPLECQQESVRKWRQIGLGIMGLADMFIALGITYGDDASLELSDEIGKCMINTAMQQSARLAKQDGPYPGYDQEAVMTSTFFKANANKETIELVKEYGLRHSQLLTIAPTGSISNLLEVSNGIEPIYAFEYTRKTESLHKEDVYYNIKAKIVQDYLNISHQDDINDLPEYFVAAKDIQYRDRVNMQAVWQKHIDASISSTANLPEDTTLEEVEDLYLYAWSQGLKGITIYRDQCERVGIMTEEPKATEEETQPEVVEDKEDINIYLNPTNRGQVIKVPKNAIGRNRDLTTGCGTLHCSAYFDHDTGAILATYLSKGSTGGCNNFMIAVSRLISLSARAGVSIDSIVDQLHSCGTCSSYNGRSLMHHDTSMGSCCPVAVSYALKEMYEEIQEELKEKIEMRNRLAQLEAMVTSVNTTTVKTEEEKPHIDIKYNDPLYEDRHKINDYMNSILASNMTEEASVCPECGGPLVHEGGCNMCHQCGWTKCS